jgi:prenyltransferase beta subunit
MDGGFGCTPGGESHAGQSMLYVVHHICFNITCLPT